MSPQRERLLERERRIARAYADGYGASPQEEWVGHAGLEAGARLLKDEQAS